MRYLLKANMPVEEGNKSIKNGSLGKIMKDILTELKPEAAYFTADHGKRSAILIININDASEIVKVAEPFFLAWNADVTLTPVMNAEDLEKGSRHFESLVSKYSQR